MLEKLPIKLFVRSSTASMRSSMFAMLYATLMLLRSAKVRVVLTSGATGPAKPSSISASEKSDSPITLIVPDTFMHKKYTPSTGGMAM